MLTTSLSQQLENIVCSYVNATNTIQIARIANISNWYFERVVFPGQRLIFESPTEGILEIHTSQLANATLTAKIPCQKINIDN